MDLPTPAEDRFVALAFADELADCPELLASWASAFPNEDDATLLIYAPDADPQTLAGKLAAVLAEAGIDEAGGPDLFALALPGAADTVRRLAASVHCVLSRQAPVEPLLRGLPLAGDGDVPLLHALAATRHRATEPVEIPFALGTHLQDPSPPWARQPLPACAIPGMITDEEARYYVWIGAAYAGVGAAVELGPWLGRSTAHILEGLLANDRFAGRQLTVVDDFVWRSSWMDGYYAGPDRPVNHGDFQPIFERLLAPVREHLDVRKRRIALYDGNDAVAPLSWDGGPVEIAYVDCGRTFEANEAWWQVLEPHFIPGRTLVIMQDWQLYKEQPTQWYNQTKEFTDAKGSALELIHELVDGNVGTFLYRGRASTPPAPSGAPRPVLVAGMHRSGTSAVARVVDLLGVDVGPRDALVPPAEDNPTGFWESRDLVDLNESVLAAIGGSWCDAPGIAPGWEHAQSLVPFSERARAAARSASGGSAWAWKDPRLCLTLPFWRQALDVEPVVVLPYRNPLAVWRSLETRNGIDKHLALALWERYVRRALDGAAGLPTFVLCYDELLEDADRVAGELASFLGRQGIPARPPDPVSLHEFLDPGIRHAAFTLADAVSDPDLSPQQLELLARLETMRGAHDRLAAVGLPAETRTTEALLELKRRLDRVWAEAHGAARSEPAVGLSHADRLRPAGVDHRSYVGPADRYDVIGAGQFRLLTTIGLREHHALLDIGCGSLRGGRLFIPYLAVGGYHAIEPNTWLVEAGIQTELGADAIRLKRPVFSADGDFTLTTFGRQFDFLLAQSIFSHTSVGQLHRCLDQARQVMGPDSVLAATFVQGETNYDGDEWVYPGASTYTLPFMLTLIDGHGLAARPTRWPHPNGQTWLLITPAGSRERLDALVAVADAASGVPAG